MAKQANADNAIIAPALDTDLVTSTDNAPNDAPAFDSFTANPAALLADTITEITPETATQLRPAPGVHAIFIPAEKNGRATYTRMGYRVARKGDGFLLNESEYDINEQGELVRGDALIGVVSEKAYQAYVAADRQRCQQLQKEGGGDLKVSDRPFNV